MTNAELETWFKRWRKPIRQWVSKFLAVNSCDADDIAQEVFVRLLRYSSDKVVENPQGYLFRIAANVVHARAECHSNWKEHIPIHMMTSDWDELLLFETPESSAERASEDARIRAAVMTLPERRRRILLRHLNEGLTYKEIALAEKITYRIVLRELTKGYASLRVRLS